MPNITHGHSRVGNKSREYRSWQAMKGRCMRKTDPAYERYGGAGITICEEWINSFEAFYADMGPRPEEHSLDRIDPYGNYEPGNVRWAARNIQSINKKTHSNKASGVKGVRFYKATKRWKAYIGVNKNQIHLGYFKTKEAAIEARLAAEEQYYKPLLNN